MKTGFGASAASLFDARPQQTQRAEFRQRQELVGIGAEAERQSRAGLVKRDATGFQRTQIGDRDRKRESKFLRLRSAGIMNRAAVGERERPLEATADEVADHPGEWFLHFGPGRRGRATHGHGAERLIVEADIDFGGIDTAGLDDDRRG